MKAVTPQEAKEHLATRVFPDFVIASFNECILRARVKNTTTVLQDDVMDEILKRRPEFTRAEVFSNNWLDVEEFYRAAGWKVRYDKPAYNESYKAHWTFT